MLPSDLWLECDEVEHNVGDAAYMNLINVVEPLLQFAAIMKGIIVLLRGWQLLRGPETVRIYK